MKTKSEYSQELQNAARWLEISGLTRQKFARKLDVGEMTVYGWERRGVTPSVYLLPRIAEVLGCKIEDLYVR